MIERVKDDIFVRTKLVELRIRLGEIIVTRLFSSHIHHPLVLFTVTDDEMESASPDNVKFVDGIVQFHTKSGIEGVLKTNSNNAILLQMSSDCKFGFMFPSVTGECLFGDSIHCLDKKFTTSAQYHCTSDDPSHQQLSLPMIHLTTKDSCLAVSLPKESSVEFCHYIHNGFPYFNATSINSMEVAFRSFNTPRAAISDFYHRYGYVSPDPMLEPSDIFQAKKALYTNCEIINPSINDQAIQDAKQAQSMLNNDSLSNCVIGSLAMVLHGHKTNVKDVDIVVKYLDHAKQTFKDYEISTASSGKWKNCSFRINMGQTQIDIVQLYKFDWKNVIEKNSVNILNKHGLLSMKLLGEFERSLINPNYQVFQHKNRDSILNLFDDATYVYPFFSDFLRNEMHNRFGFIKNLMKDAKWDFVPLNVSFPLYANVYKKDNLTFIPIINEGSSTPGKIRIGKHLTSAIWYPLNSEQQKCEVISTENFSEIQIPFVEHAGLLVGKNV